MTRSDALKAAKQLQLYNAPLTDVMFHGHTMEPILTEGDKVFLERIDFDQVRVGDIVTTYDAHKYPTRRVVEKNSDSIL